MEKTEIYPIQCQSLDLVQSMGQQFQASHFPCTYLGFPLHTRKLPRTSVQPLVQKVANRLPGWKRKFFSYPGREALIKSVLSAIPTYFLTSFKMNKWAIHNSEKFMRAFLWRGKEYDTAKGGHCLVRWKKCARPKTLGGLGIKDIEKFNRALRLRWLWFSWDKYDSPWKGILKSKDPTERQLFFTSTEITLGDGNRTPFWEARWLNGTAPKTLAPQLYQLARYKFRTVHKELDNNNWIRNLGELTTHEQMKEFVKLFTSLRDVELTDQPDEIKWRWTADGIYTTKSAYLVQFLGATKPQIGKLIWKARIEPKCKFLAWLAIQGKAPTVDNLAKKTWPHNSQCSLCFCQPETNDHLFMQCNFTEATWIRIAQALQLPVDCRTYNPNGVSKWVQSIVKGKHKEEQKTLLGTLFSFWWEIWKERNRRIFENKEASHQQVSNHILEHINTYRIATNTAISFD